MRDAAIVGGGLAGAALAIRLARAGRDAVLLERTAAPHDKVCGEFLSGEAVSELAALGVDVSALGGVPIARVSIGAGHRVAEAALPFPAISLSRRVLDEALLDRARAAGAEIRRGVSVRATGPGWVEAEGRIAARSVVLATGKHELRGHARTGRRWVGLKLQLRLDAPATTAIHLFRGGYAGLQPIEDGWATLCLATSDPALAACGRDGAALLARMAQLAPGLVLAGAVPRWPKPLAVAGVPYGFLHRDRGGEDVFRVGDQLAVIASFCGDGMAVALHSARWAADAIVAGLDAGSFHREARRRLRGQFRRAAWLSWTAEHGWGRTAFVAAARRWPGALRHAALATRVA